MFYNIPRSTLVLMGSWGANRPIAGISGRFRGQVGRILSATLVASQTPSAFAVLEDPISRLDPLVHAIYIGRSCAAVASRFHAELGDSRRQMVATLRYGM